MNSPDNSDSCNHAASNLVPESILDNHEKNCMDNNHRNEYVLENNNFPPSKEEKSFDIKNFIAESEIKNTIHVVSTSNDLAIIGEVNFLFISIMDKNKT